MIKYHPSQSLHGCELCQLTDSSRDANPRLRLCVCASPQSFFETHQVPAAERTVQQCCENILLNATWLKRDADDIHQYLLQRKAPPV